MDLFKSFGSYYRCYRNLLSFPHECNREKQYSFSKYEYYTYKFQSIVVWEHPGQTVSCLLIIQLLFWMIVNLCWKFYGIIFTLLLVFCTHDVWTEKIWPEIRLPQTDVPSYHEAISKNPRMLTTDQIDEYFNNFLMHAKMTIFRLRNLRNSHPTLFCSMLSFFFGALTIVGCTISGIWLLYLTVMAIFVSPGLYIHVLPQSTKVSLKQYVKDFSSILSEFYNGGGSDDFEEYVPKATEKKFNEAYASVFQVVDNDPPSLTDDDIASGLIAMPSFDDSSVDGIGKFVDIKGDLDFSDSSSVSSNASESLKFQGAHFNNATDELDTSEDDNERAFMPDLMLQQQPVRRTSDSLLGNIASRIAMPDISQFGRSIFNMIPLSSSSSEPFSSSLTSKSSSLPDHKSSLTSRGESKHYSTDEEFEMINESDIN